MTEVGAATASTAKPAGWRLVSGSRSSGGCHGRGGGPLTERGRRSDERDGGAAARPHRVRGSSGQEKKMIGLPNQTHTL
nr:unnamed protein product [Digitaria exilis]